MKLTIGEQISYNLHDWVAEKIDCNMNSGIMTVRFISAEKLHLRVLNELESQSNRIAELEAKLSEQSSKQ